MYCGMTTAPMYVAPPAGAWIETPAPTASLHHHHVAPPAGAWIETGILSVSMLACKSHPLRVRGLKRTKPVSSPTTSWSHPLRVRGLKLNVFFPLCWIWRRTPCGCVD